MRSSFVPVAVSALLLGACSPAQYKVNPPAVKEVPESQQDGYMRIAGDLRWDQLTSKEEWIRRFPKCLTYNKDTLYLDDGDYVFVKVVNTGYCDDAFVGGILLSPTFVRFVENTGTESKTMSRTVGFGFLNASQSRAFKSAIAQKYVLTTSGYCSKFTCWNLGDVNQHSAITAKPTPYTVSILDNVKINKSDI